MKNQSSFFIQRFSNFLLVVLIILFLSSFYYAKEVAVFSFVGMTLTLIVLYFVNRRIKSLERELHLTQGIMGLSELILESRTKEDLYQKILDTFVESVSEASKGSLITIDNHGKLYFEAALGFDLETVRQVDMKLENTYLFKAINNEIPASVVVTDIATRNQSMLSQENLEIMNAIGTGAIKATICIPITIGKKLFGMINVDSLVDTEFDKAEIKLVEKYAVEVSKIVRLYELHARNEHSERYDSLTGTYTRREFKHQVEALLGQDQAHQQMIVYFDLDKLNEINKTYGYDVGDLYINHFVACINSRCLTKDVFSRFAGDEFILFMTRDDTNVEPLNGEWQAWFKKHPLIYKGVEIIVDFSHGEAVYGVDGQHLSDLIRVANDRMYHMKMSKKVDGSSQI